MISKSNGPSIISILLLGILSVSTVAIGQTLPKEELIFLTSAWKGERFEDGRPKVSDDLLKTCSKHRNRRSLGRLVQ